MFAHDSLWHQGLPEPRTIKHLKINSVPTVWSVLSCGQPFSHAGCSAIFSTRHRNLRTMMHESRPLCHQFVGGVCAGPRACYDLWKPMKYVRAIDGALHSKTSVAIVCSRTHTCTGGAFEMNRWDRVRVKGPVVDAAILSSRCNWATATCTRWHTRRAPPLPYVKVHPSSQWLLHGPSNCMPKHVCVRQRVCVRACLPASPGSNPMGHELSAGLFHFCNGALGASFVPVCSGRNHHGAPPSLPRKEKEKGGVSRRGEREHWECLSVLIQTRQSLCLCHNLFSNLRVHYDLFQLSDCSSCLSSHLCPASSSLAPVLRQTAAWL